MINATLDVTVEYLQPPARFQQHRWHYLQHSRSELEERMMWYSHPDAITYHLVRSYRYDAGGWWIRIGTPLSGKLMKQAGWCYVRLDEKQLCAKKSPQQSCHTPHVPSTPILHPLML